ncbi:MAG: hypothetical protein AAF348_18675 [Bacteroidota bacterium]
MKLYIILSCIALMLSFACNARDINGKWMLIRNPEILGGPLVNIMEIENDSIFSYNFKKLIEKDKIKIVNNTLYLKDSLSVNFSFINENVMEITSPQGKQDSYNQFRYVRIVPTNDRSDQINNFEDQTFGLSFANEELLFKMGEKKAKEYIIIVKNPRIVTDKIGIEKWEKTYFLCFYLFNRLHYAFPIKEIKEDYLSLYDIPGKFKDLTAKRIIESE